MSPSKCYGCKKPAFGSYTPITESLQQSLLGASLDGQLRNLPPSDALPIANYITQREFSLHTSFIARLSDELLNEIFIYALSGKLWRSRFPQRALTLSKVSKRFYRIVQPLMYSAIDLKSHNIAPPCKAATLLHRAMKENQALASMVRTLFVHIEYRTAGAGNSFTIARELLDFVRNVESFELYGGYDRPKTWPMIKSAFKNWPRIKHVTLSMEKMDLFTTPVCELILATPSLRTMTLNGIFAPSLPYNTSRPVWTPATKDMERTSNITELTIADFGERPEALRTLLKLPKALEHFTFGGVRSNLVQWCPEMFQWLLADHQSTLKSIEIGCLGMRRSPINFMGYPKLQKLNLSHWVYYETAETAAASLLAPSLHTFIWDFQIYDQHSEQWTDFDEPQKKWLLRFAELAAARNSALRKIEIVFKPDVENYVPITTRAELADCVTPWDLMDEVKAKIKPLGIELEYNQCWTREECLQRIERAEKEREESGWEETLPRGARTASQSS